MYVIAEIGFNHNGDMATANQMIRAAANAGADAVKFQTFRAKDIASPASPHYDSILSGELNPEQHKMIFDRAKDCGVDFISTPFSPGAVELLEKLNVPAYKVASMDCTNKYLLKYIAQTRKPIFLSTGMATLVDIADTLEFLKAENSGAISLLHCISMYPTIAEDLNLEIIPLLKNMFGRPVGYSDHFPGTRACLAAAMLGAEIIETHFTLDSTLPEGDHYHSADPEDLKTLIADMELYKIMRGDAKNIFERPDRHFATTYRRGLYTARSLAKGEVLKVEDLLMCRPTSDLSPNDIDRLIGKRVNQALPAQTTLKETHVEH